MEFSKDSVPKGYVLNKTKKTDGGDIRYGITPQMVFCHHCGQDVTTYTEYDPESYCKYLVGDYFLFIFTLGFFYVIIHYFWYNETYKVVRTHRCPVCQNILGKSVPK